MARTFPSIGVSPIDAYVTGERPAAYFEQVVTLASTTERHAVEIIGTPTMISNANYASLYILVTPAGTGGLWACPIFTRVNFNGAYVSGYVNAAEFEVNVNGTAATLACAYNILTLISGGTGGARHSGSAYIWLRDYGTGKMDNLFRFFDATIETNSTSALLSVTGAKTHSHSIRVLFGTTSYWIMCTSTAPAGG